MNRIDWHRMFGLLLTDFFQRIAVRRRTGKRSIDQADSIRVVVLGQLPNAEHNAVLHLLSARPDKVRYGAGHYQQHSSETSTLLDELFQGYQREGVAMPYTMEDFKREYREERFNELTHEERLKLLKQLTPQERLEGLSAKEIEEVESYLKRRKEEAAAPKRKKKK